MLTDLLEYVSTVAENQEAERKCRRQAYQKLKTTNPRLAELLACMVAGEWRGAEDDLCILLEKPPRRQSELSA